MSDKKFTVNPGDEIIISVPKRNPIANEILMRRNAPPKAMVRVRRQSDFLPRRLKKKGLINFFDTGQIKSGASWTTRPTAFFNDVDISPAYNPGNPDQFGWLFDHEPPDSSQFGTLAANILTDINGREIKKSNANSLTLIIIGFTGTITEPDVQFLYQSSGSDDNWTEDGLKLTEDQRNAKMLFGDSRGDIYAFGVYEGNKITTVNNFEADAVNDFRLDQSAQIYFVPSLRNLRGDSTTHTDGTRDILTTWGMVWRHKPRFFDEPNAIIETNSGEIEAYNRAVATGPHRAFTHEFYFASPHIRSAVQTGGTFNVADPNFSVNYLTIAEPPTGALLGVIKQKGQTYYFWQTAA